MKKTIKIMLLFMLLFTLVLTNNIIYASCGDYDTSSECSRNKCHWDPKTKTCSDRSDITYSSSTSTSTSTDWWGKASGFLSGYKGEDTEIGTSTVGEIIGFLNPLVTLVRTVGNMIFVAITVMLGVKYIWGGVESKASVKDSLMTLVVAALVFYGWNTISGLFMSGNNLSFIQGTFEGTATGVYSIVIYVANFLAVGGIVYIGIRYMMAGAEGKAQLKAKGVPVVLGIIMVYATITFLNLIVGIL